MGLVNAKAGEKKAGAVAGDIMCITAALALCQKLVYTLSARIPPCQALFWVCLLELVCLVPFCCTWQSARKTGGRDITKPSLTLVLCVAGRTLLVFLGFLSPLLLLTV